MALLVNNLPANAGDIRDVGSIPRRRAWQLTPVFLPGEPLWKEERATVHRVARSWTQLKRLSTQQASQEELEVGLWIQE